LIDVDGLHRAVLAGCPTQVDATRAIISFETSTCWAPVSAYTMRSLDGKKAIHGTAVERVEAHLGRGCGCASVAYALPVTIGSSRGPG